jgi:hypothetical protein
MNEDNYDEYQKIRITSDGTSPGTRVSYRGEEVHGITHMSIEVGEVMTCRAVIQLDSVNAAIEEGNFRGRLDEVTLQALHSLPPTVLHDLVKQLIQLATRLEYRNTSAETIQEEQL